MNNQNLADHLTNIRACEELRTMPLYEHMEDFTILHLVDLMKEPMRAIGSVVSKGQALKLCSQMLAQNLALQEQVSKSRNEMEEARDAFHAYHEMVIEVCKKMGFDIEEELDKTDVKADE